MDEIDITANGIFQYGKHEFPAKLKSYVNIAVVTFFENNHKAKTAASNDIKIKTNFQNSRFSTTFHKNLMQQ